MRIAHAGPQPLTRALAAAALSVSLLVAHAPDAAAQRVSAAQLGADELIGDFYYFESPGAEDGVDRSFIATLASDSGAGLLLWQCLADKMNVILDHGQIFVGDEARGIRVHFRFDDHEESEERTWVLSMDNQSSFVPESDIRAFTDEGIPSGSVRLDVRDPLSGDELRFRFPLASLDSALGKLGCWER